jgi:hypothetical protein
MHILYKLLLVRDYQNILIEHNKFLVSKIFILAAQNMA